MPALGGDVGRRVPRRLQVGEWSVDASVNELRRRGEVVRVEPKAMDVLIRLAGDAGQVVTREELFAAVWPGVVVGDEALTQSIIKLRRALGDDRRSPAYIETVSKRGYRLVAPVRAVDPAESSEPAGAPPADVFAATPDAGAASPVPDPSRQRTGALARWAVGLALVTLLAVVHFARPSPDPLIAAPEASEVTGGGEDSWLTVTVLPFEALGPAPDQIDHIARGISDNLLTELSLLAGLRLIRQSAAAPNAVGAGRYQVAGSVQRDGDILRVHVHLADTASSAQLWAGRYQRPVGDLFALQDEITREVLGVLPARVSEVERQRLARRYTRSLEAYDHFLRGRALFLVRGDAENDEARLHYRKALELDPTFARAYASLAMTYAIEYRLRPLATPAAALDRAFELAETARLIDPELPEVYWALGFVHVQGRRHEEAIVSLRRSIQIDRSFADGYALLAGVYTYIGQPGTSIPLARTAARLHPDAGYLYFVVLGRAYVFANDPEQAIINLREALQRNPVDLESRVMLAGALVAAGDTAGANWEANEIRSLRPGFSVREWLETYPMTDLRQRQRLIEWLAKVGL